MSFLVARHHLGVLSVALLPRHVLFTQASCRQRVILRILTSNCLRLPYFHGNYSLLCQKLAQEIPLRSLRLVIDGAWCGEGEMKYWAQQLVQITGLRRLAVEMSINLDTESIVR